MSETHLYHIRVTFAPSWPRLMTWFRTHGVTYGRCELAHPPFFFFSCTREQASLLRYQGFMVQEGFPHEMCTEPH
jgi:hypothetical protein